MLTVSEMFQNRMAGSVLGMTLTSPTLPQFKGRQTCVTTIEMLLTSKLSLGSDNTTGQGTSLMREREGGREREMGGGGGRERERERERERDKQLLASRYDNYAPKFANK